MSNNLSSAVKEIYNRLRDDESRAVFQGLLSYLTDGRQERVWDTLRVVSGYDRVKPRPPGIPPNFFSLDERLAPAVFYGAGGNASCIKDFAGSLGIKAAAYCDSDPKKQGLYKDELPIIPPNVLQELYPDSPVIISSPIYEDEINKSLVQMGVSPDRIFSSVFSETQYFGLSFLKPQQDEIYLDAGPYDGKTIIQFAGFCGGDYKKIYALEPDPENCRRVLGCIESNGIKNVSVAGKGVWSFCGSLRLARGDSGSCLSEDGEIEIPVTTIDETVGCPGATFIKMDIEGAELEALRGARETIERFAPRLAVCVYHKPGDFLDIPAYLLEVYPGYGFYLRCHTLSPYEIVLYALPD